MSDSSPDAHMIQVDCGECAGSGSLHGAYQTVRTQRDSLATRLSDAGGQMLFMRTELESLKKELESHKRMLLAAACDIGAIGEALGADMDDDGSAIEGLAQEMAKDAERLDFLESLARSSYTGASIVKGEAKKSLEVMWFHKRAGAMPSLREAIDAAKEHGQ